MLHGYGVQNQHVCIQYAISSTVLDLILRYKDVYCVIFGMRKTQCHSEVRRQNCVENVFREFVMLKSCFCFVTKMISFQSHNLYKYFPSLSLQIQYSYMDIKTKKNNNKQPINTQWESAKMPTLFFLYPVPSMVKIRQLKYSVKVMESLWLH